MGGGGATGAELFEVIELGREGGEEGGGGFEGFAEGLGEHFGGGFAAEVDDELARANGVIEVEREFRDKIVADQVDDGDVAKAFVGAEGHFEVGDFGVCVLKALLGILGQGFEEGVGVKIRGAAEREGRVEPAEQGLTFGVEVIIDFHGVAVGGGVGFEALEPVFEADSGPG